MLHAHRRSGFLPPVQRKTGNRLRKQLLDEEMHEPPSRPACRRSRNGIINLEALRRSIAVDKKARRRAPPAQESVSLIASPEQHGSAAKPNGSSRQLEKAPPCRRATPMNTAAPKVARCAVYTRKSTEHNLDLAFTSLDAQREACEAYIRSQAGEGWRLVPERYDDGGLSGASLDRPALQGLLAEVRARRVDVVTVYKVDRLTRSLADFAKLIELFDAHGVSFVSVTQSFNTTTSMGRLTLNILLSFAQFEREVIGERVRDKIAASKRKGMWVGGPVPLGYAALAKRIVVAPDEAATVRTIFSRYLELGSVRALAQHLERGGTRTKQRKLASGRIIGGGAFGVGALAYLLRNRFYIGEVVYRGETFRGDHEPILDPTLFAVPCRRCRIRGVPALLAGRLFDEQGHRMTPTHTNKKGVRYSSPCR
jgi:DNA invertase Pin-like site-specific DNA recombinase